jgi:glucokinase
VRYVLGVDLGATNLRVALGDPSGVVAARAVEPVPATGAELAARVAALAHALAGRAELEGVAVGVPGVPVGDGVQDLIAGAAGLAGAPLRALLADALGVPVVMENDLNLAALAEQRHRGVADLAFIGVGTGVGMGVVAGGRLLRGASGAAGELGHLPLDVHRVVAGDDGLGPLEAVAGGAGLAARWAARDEPGGVARDESGIVAGDESGVVARDEPRLVGGGEAGVAARDEPWLVGSGEAGDAARDEPRLVGSGEAGDAARDEPRLVGGGEAGVVATARDVFAAADRGDPVAVALLVDQARALAAAVRAVCALLDPALVVLGGGIGSRPDVLARVRSALEAHGRATPPLEASVLGEDAGLVGALIQAGRWGRPTAGL